MKKKYLIAGYRDWSKNVQLNLNDFTDLVENSEDLIDCLKNNIYEIVFLVGWSEIIDEKFLKKENIYCIHPSDLPKYRGGSPIQHQIIDGLKSSYVTLFRLNNGIDCGPIYSKRKINLEGTLNDVFIEISKASIILIKNFINDFESTEIKLMEQNESEASYYKRRHPNDSEITIDEILNQTAEKIHNKIRCLQKPYPEPFIKCSDGSKLYILKSRI